MGNELERILRDQREELLSTDFSGFVTRREERMKKQTPIIKLRVMKKMRLMLVPLMAFVILTLTGCSSDGDEPELTTEQKAAKYQEELYQKVKSVIVGHWVGVQHYNTTVFRTEGWEDISYIYWDQEYTFNADGTVVDHFSDNLIYTGTYTITKNKDYTKSPSIQCELWLTITYDNGVVSRSCIWLDGQYLRLGSSITGIKPSDKSGGEAGIRYAKS